MSVESLEQERDDLKRQLRAYQEMLFQVLDEVGQPVLVEKQKMSRDSATDRGLSVTEDGDYFVFQIEEIVSG